MLMMCCRGNVSHGLSFLATVQQRSVQDLAMTDAFLAGTDAFLVDGVGLPVAKLPLIEDLGLPDDLKA